MRQADSLQDRVNQETAIPERQNNREIGFNGKQLPQVQVQDFQKHDWPSSRRPSLGNTSISPRMKATATPSMPDLYQRLKQVPIPHRLVNEQHQAFQGDASKS